VERARAIRVGRGLAALLALSVVLLAYASPAGATQYQRPLKEVFGPVAQPLFERWPAVIAIDPSTGTTLVGQFQTGEISRFASDGTSAAFGALGTNLLDGKAGPGGKPCAEEPASCDRTPQDGIEISSNGAASQQLAIDPTNGNIYITQQAKNLVDIFSSEGRYLGQLTAAGNEPFNHPTGVTVDIHGTVFVTVQLSRHWSVAAFEPSGNPPVNTDSTAVYPIPAADTAQHQGLAQIVAGAGPTAGLLFVASSSNNAEIFKVDEESGAVQTFATGYNEAMAVDPISGNPLACSGCVTSSEVFSELFELDGTLESASSVLSRTIVEPRATTSNIRILDYAYGSSGDLYVVYGEAGSAANVLVYSRPAVVPTVTLEHVTELTSSGATLNGTVNAEGLPVGECFFEWGKTLNVNFPRWEYKAPCEGSTPPDSTANPVQAMISGLEPNGVKYNFRLAARNEHGIERTPTEFFISASTVVTDPATVTGTTTATLNGTLRPEGSQYTECVFEWGIATHAGFEEMRPCDPEAAEIPPDHGSHAVDAALSGLREQTRYRYRIKASNAEGTRFGAEGAFKTFGPPQITALRASGADEHAVTLEAEINPSGFETSYWFEWGTTTRYGSRTPVSPDVVGAGEDPVLVTARLTGLSSAGTYHYRVVATNGAEGALNRRASIDQTAQTLNECRLPEGRCLESVSPRQLGPIAGPGRQLAAIEFNSQAGDQPGAVAYTVEAGLPGATRGTQVLYLGTRRHGGWVPSQLSPEGTAPNEITLTSNPSQYFALSPDVSCGVLASNQPLTPDPQAKLVVEAGGGNLYRRNPDGSYTLITTIPPENPEVATGKYTKNYNVDAVSRNCDRVVFDSSVAKSSFTYPGVPGNLYEWHNGALSGIGLVPDGNGGEAVGEGAVAGTAKNHVNVLSEDGSRLFFSAKRLAERVPGEVGTMGIFARQGGHSYDISASATARPDEGATYAGATPDGSRVYFMANSGLTTESSNSGTDLYECRIDVNGAGEPQCVLRDLSVDPGGAAEVKGLLGFADDGSHVYFAAQAQLLPGRGPTIAENVAAGQLSVYDAGPGGLEYVGTIATAGLNQTTTLVQSSWNSRTSPDGRYLVFESTAQVTEYENNGRPEVYLYDADAASGSEATVCVSCRQDGRPPVFPPPGQSAARSAELLAAGGLSDPLSTPRSLVVRNGRPEVFFRSLDSLAPGAPSGELSLYEWADGQVFLLAAQPPTVGPNGANVTLVGANATGNDLYFFDAAALNWENRSERYAVWDARVGGGFGEPLPLPPGCNPDGEGSCQGSSPQPGAAPPPATANTPGSGNVKPKHKRRRHRKNHHKRRKGHHQHKKKHHKQGKKQTGKKGKRSKSGGRSHR
jgi:hypothetical protein